jgi:hypothetical protein
MKTLMNYEVIFLRCFVFAVVKIHILFFRVRILCSPQGRRWMHGKGKLSPCFFKLYSMKVYGRVGV